MMDKWKELLKQIAGPAESTEKAEGAAKKEEAGGLREVVVIGPRNQKRKQ